MNYWRGIWASPMAAVYAEVDEFPLTRLALLVHERDQGGGSATSDGEIRALEDRFGLSPLSRRRLSWEISEATGRHAELHAVPDEGDPRRLSVEDRLARMDPRALHVPGLNDNGGSK